MINPASKNTITGIGLAVLAAIIWSGNFVVAKVVAGGIPPVSLAFYRWLTASVIILPFAIKQFKAEWKTVLRSWHYFFWVALSGIALFNTFVYVGAHYTTAINLALIGTTSSPIISVALARIFLKEKIGLHKITGMIICIIGVLFLLSKDDPTNLLHLHFDTGDLCVLLAAFCFSVYNTLVKKKPAAVSPVNFLFVAFSLGTIMLLPFFFWEISYATPVDWNNNYLLAILYLGLGTSVISFMIWNTAIQKLGAGRTALFGNLIPVFSSLEAALFLHEKFTIIHRISLLIVFAGIVIANWQNKKTVAVTTSIPQD